MKRFFLPIFFFCTASFSIYAGAQNRADDDKWLKNYDARVAWYEQNMGALPKNVIKMRNMVGVWRGGGLLAFPAPKLGDKVWAYSTFGLSNADMPATLLQDTEKVEAEKNGRIRFFSLELKNKKPAAVAPDWAGYGYEVVILAREQEDYDAQKRPVMPHDWPIWALQWLVTAEIYKDVGIRKRVMVGNGLVVNGIKLGKKEKLNLLIVPAPKPLQQEMILPRGKAMLLVAIAVSDAEVRWASENGHRALYKKLMASDVGMFSSRTRSDISLSSPKDMRTRDIRDEF